MSCTMAGLLAGLLVLATGLTMTSADIPANCSYEEILGRWNFSVAEGGGDQNIDCQKMPSVVNVVQIELQYPDLAIDKFGNRGFWTIIYNQGFEVQIHGRSYFAFSKFTGSWPNATSFCDQTLPGWSHDFHGKDWACFSGQKQQSLPPKPAVYKSAPVGQLYQHDAQFLADINAAQNLWKAVRYPEYEQMTVEQMMMRAGGRSSHSIGSVRAVRASREIQDSADGLPDQFDWRDVNGVNYVSPIRSQDGCGSCYAFASAVMHEARLRIMTNNTVNITLSPQDVVDCSHYSQGCSGGCMYLTGGKYAEDYGWVEEECKPYVGKDGTCTTSTSCHRHYAHDYRYVGGYYGGCSEPEMRLSLVNNGPLVVGYAVYADFFTYKSGIYRHTEVSRRFNPFQEVQHAVTIVGYGVDGESGTKYWIVQNSWGTTFGEDGFFRIVRGEDECAFESMASEAIPAF